MKYLFGPVNSRRLGRSLGLDLIPSKLCNFNCIYCEVGPKSAITNARREYSPVKAILREVDDFLAEPDNVASFDLLTITASGEPTLHSGIGSLIRSLKQRTAKPIAVLTNGSLLSDPAVRQDLCGADLVVPSLDAALNGSFQRVNRPHAEIGLDAVIEGLSLFSREFGGRLWLEILFVEGINDSEVDIAALEKVLPRIAPAKIQLNTVIRPPMESTAKALSFAKLQAIASRLGPAVEIIASFQGDGRKDFRQVDPEAIIAMLRRRPCTEDDIRIALGYNRSQTKEILRRLLDEKRISIKEHDGITYYT